MDLRVLSLFRRMLRDLACSTHLDIILYLREGVSSLYYAEVPHRPLRDASHVYPIQVLIQTSTSRRSGFVPEYSGALGVACLIAHLSR